MNLVVSVGPSALDAVLGKIRGEAPDKATAQDRARTVSLASEELAA